ncbi:MAG: acyl-[acyl-carrier-protein]--UDP-N-acetylglucosamine O-acyltransferase, partial [Flavobacteriales bacterium]|nr:acyl-[acyl-carrier-protein]--UDP-N-acetylglucosamine O-acyltransferase [Flavobacteriales bacterium]
IGGASLIRKDVPPFVKAAREPLGFAGVNSIGLRRKGFSDEVIKEIEDIYRLLYIQNTNVSKGIEAVKEQMSDSEVRKAILGFIDASDKGIIKGLI